MSSGSGILRSEGGSMLQSIAKVRMVAAATAMRRERDHLRLTEGAVQSVELQDACMMEAHWMAVQAVSAITMGRTACIVVGNGQT